MIEIRKMLRWLSVLTALGVVGSSTAEAQNNVNLELPTAGSPPICDKCDTVPAWIPRQVDDRTGWSFCNSVRGTNIDVALVVFDTNGWRKRGWYELKEGECKMLAGINRPTGYFHAKAGKMAWGNGGPRYCVHPKNRYDIDASVDCPNGFKVFDFSRIDFEGESSWRTILGN